MTGKLLPGKLPAKVLAAFFAQLPHDPAVVVGPAVGEDAAVIARGENYLVVALDPVTLSDQPGRFVVQINVNDVAVMGAKPRWLLAALILPGASTGASSLEDAERILGELSSTCRELNIALVGGHSEVSSAVSRPVVVGCLLGEAKRDELVTSAGARPGDALLLAGGFPIEGAAILAREFAPVLRAKGVPSAVIKRAAGWLDEPGISVLRIVQTIMGVTHPHALHDPTEGGVSTALYELAAASNVKLVVCDGSLSPLPDAASICTAIGLDPLGLLASGCVLAAIEPEATDDVLQALSIAGIPGTVIGCVLAGSDVVITSPAGEIPMPRFARDELARWWEECTQGY
jgi:hydrogenase expression/formation protein HypE